MKIKNKDFDVTEQDFILIHKIMYSIKGTIENVWTILSVQGIKAITLKILSNKTVLWIIIIILVHQDLFSSFIAAVMFHILKAGVAKSQNWILVHGQLVVQKHLSVPRHYLPVHK